MNVIGCHDVIEHAQTEALSRFEEPMQIAASLARKPEKKLSLMTAVGDVPNVMRQEVAVGSGHAASIDAMTRLLQRKRGRKKSL